MAARSEAKPTKNTPAPPSTRGADSSSSAPAKRLAPPIGPAALPMDSRVVAIPLMAPLREGCREAHVFVDAIERMTEVERQQPLTVLRSVVAARRRGADRASRAAGSSASARPCTVVPSATRFMPWRRSRRAWKNIV